MHLTKQIAVSVAAFVATTSLVCGAGQQFTQFDVPGATSTYASGINPGADIVGVYYDSSGSGHGYLLSNGAFTTIDAPGATSTFANGINTQGEIVGSYIGSGKFHGYLLSNGAFTTIDVPGATFTQALGINSRGDIVGYYDDSSSGIHGFLLSALNFDPNPIYTAHGDFTNMDLTFTTPSLTAGQNYVITVTADEGSSFDAIVTIKDPNGNIVVNAQDTGTDETINFSAEVTGQYTIIVMSFGGTMGPFTVNVYNGVTTIDVPGADITEPLGINSLGDIVGIYYDSSFNLHSFLLSKGSFTTIDAPRAAQTFASGIDRQGDIVGSVDVSRGNTHGFLLRKGKYSAIAVPGAIQTSASGIDDLRGNIVGNFTDGSRNTHGFLLSR